MASAAAAARTFRRIKDPATILHKITTSTPGPSGKPFEIPLRTTQVAKLERLPKAPQFKALQFRATAEGSTAQLRYPQNPHLSIDVTHPVHRVRPKDVPQYRSPLLGAVRAVPFAKLAPHESSSLNDPYPPGVRRRKSSQAPFSVVINGGPANLHQSACVRVTIRRRLREALKLVLTRGASAVESTEAKRSSRISLPEDPVDPHDLSLERWTYVFWPTLWAYKAPMPELIKELRAALEILKSQGEQLESSWKREGARLPTRR